MLTTDSAGNLLTTSGILTNEANVGFEVPEGQSKYLTAGNDVVDLSKWNGTGSVNIGDIFSSDNDKVTVMAKNLAAGADLKLTSIENLEIVNSGTTASVALNSTNFKGLEAIKLIGDGTTLNVSALTQGVKVDATADADHIRGSDKADTINGGAGNDIIVGNDGDDVLTGGNGADTFVVGSIKDAGVDQILDFSAEDKISIDSLSIQNFSAQELKKFDASTFSTVTYKTLDSVLATFGSGGANVTGSGDVVIFSYDGKTYALMANGPFTETGSALVDITGANVASLTESNFGGATNPTPPEPIIPAPPVEPYPDYAAFVNAVAFGTIPAGKLAEILTLEGQEAGLLAVNKTYLDKIAAGGIKNVTSDIVVTVGTGADNLSNNFDSTGFKTKLADGALGSNVMNITGSNADDVIVTYLPGGTITGGSGDDTITAHATAASIDGGSGADVITANAAATINGDAGDDTIYLNAGGSVNGGAGDDTITVSGSGNATIEGSGGNDTIILGAGADVVKFTSTDEANANTIKNFGTTDKLSFLKTAFGNITWTAESNNFTQTFSSNHIAGNSVYFGTDITDTTVGSLVTNSSNANALAITQTGQIYYIADTDSSGITKKLVGSVNIDTLEDINIEFVGS